MPHRLSSVLIVGKIVLLSLTIMEKGLTHDHREQIRGLLSGYRKAEAVLLVRNVTGAGLKEALDCVDEIQAQHFPEPRKEPDNHMGMDAEIIAIGLFSREIISFLEYPEEYYENSREGIKITTCICQVMTRSQSVLLAECLGINAWNFNQHELDISGIDFVRLEKEFDEEIVEKIQTLHKAGFSLFYRPNG
jgi:hypothetical protein